MSNGGLANPVWFFKRTLKTDAQYGEFGAARVPEIGFAALICLLRFLKGYHRNVEPARQKVIETFYEPVSEDRVTVWLVPAYTADPVPQASAPQSLDPSASRLSAVVQVAAPL